MIRDRREEILRLHTKYSRREGAQRTEGYHPPASALQNDEEVIKRARAERNGKFDRLWQGDASDYDHDHSAADDGFVHKLWSYTQDEEQVKRIHALSGLHRTEKSGHRPDYLRRSIERAKKNVTWFYNWPEASEKADSEVWEPKAAQMLSDHPKETEFGQNELLPLKTSKEIVEAAKDGTDYIVDGLLAPGEITDLAGLAKQSGKTTFITHMLDAAIEGEEFIGLATRKTRALYLTEQGNNFADALVKSGLDDAGEALRIVQYWDLDSKHRRWDNLIKAATEVCRREGFEVLIVDTFAGLGELRGTEENNVGDISEKWFP